MTHPDPRLDATRFAVVDIETSGLSPEHHRILQVGVVVVDADGRISDRWVSRIGPGLAWWRSVGPTDIHGLRRRDLWRAPRRRTVLDELARRLGTARFVAHNAAFDLSFLVVEARRSGVDLPINDPVCTLVMSRALDPGRTRSHRLGDLCARYDIPLEHAHDALADAEATAALLAHLLREHGVHDTAQLAAFAPPSP